MLEKEKKKPTHISFSSKRRFGIELEINSFDGQNRPPKNKQPEGIDEVVTLVAANVDEGAEIRGYEHTSENNRWIVKPDSSCGMEIVSPPLKQWDGLKKVIAVVDALASDSKIKADHRCSVHVHCEIADLTESQIASIIAWWIKCEPVILDAMPTDRKRNRYCQALSLNGIFEHDGNYSDVDLIKRVGDVKYYSMNTVNYVKGNRKTMEFRTIEGGGSKDPFLVKNWVRFLIHFMETTAHLPRPQEYYPAKTEEDLFYVTPWTGLALLDPEHVLSLLGFSGESMAIPNIRPAMEFSLSNGMQQTRNWFVGRLADYMAKHKEGGIRYHARKELDSILNRFRETGENIWQDKELLAEKRDEVLFGDDFRI